MGDDIRVAAAGHIGGTALAATLAHELPPATLVRDISDSARAGLAAPDLRDILYQGFTLVIVAFEGGIEDALPVVAGAQALLAGHVQYVVVVVDDPSVVHRLFALTDPEEMTRIMAAMGSGTLRVRDRLDLAEVHELATG